MNAIANELSDAHPDRPIPAPVLRTLAICDLVDSTALVEKLGDRRSAEVMRQHDRLTRDLVARHGGREIDKTDGFLILFERPIQAVAFALDYQRELRSLGAREALPLTARIGIHVGDVVIWDNEAHDVARGAKLVEVEGLVKPIAARIMSIARPRQTLLSGMAGALAQRARAELGTGARWKAHGNYRFKGLPDPVQVHEVGEDGIAPFKAPAWAGKAHREIPWWRRPGMLFAEAAIAIAAVAVPTYFLLRSPPAIAFAARDWVVVGDLKNLTGDANFNGSLQSAFRIGLEQSQYVNVLSDLKARDTLKLMQHDPEKTPIDRNIGSEIAIRDGVRALILPTVAEIGGRVRVTVEVVDPRTQTTVYSESADGAGETSVLPSLDKINAQLRVRLGEALAMVTQESQPLEKVATKSLDALRAYSLGDKSYELGNLKEAAGFYRQAIKLDPDFARAKLWLSITNYNVGLFDDASKTLESALRQRNRLMPRDTLFAEAWQATMAGPQLAAIEKWKNLARLYPDFFFANRAVATSNWMYANNYGQDVIQFAQVSASPKNPQANISEHLLGELYLGNERYDEAVHHFAAVEAAVGSRLAGDHARAFAAQRQFEKAEALLGARRLPQDAVFDFDHWRSAFAIALDRGDWPDAWKQIDDARARFVNAGSERRYVGAVAYSLRALGAPTVSDEGLPVQVAALQDGLAGTSGIARTHRQFALLFLGYLAARDGDTKLASQVLDTVGPEPGSGDYPMLTKMQAIVRAERARVLGRPADAVALLKPELNGTELYLTHFVLMQAHAANQDWQAARGEAQWLTAHRGRAYAEVSPQELLLPYNVVLSDLAWLDAAEYSRNLADPASARAALDTLLAIWPQAPQRDALGARITALRTTLR